MSFKSIIGQDTAIKALKNIIEQDQTRGTHIFLGLDGVGKRTAAIEFAKAINCQFNKEDACNRCASCNKIDSKNHPDIFLVYPEGSSRSIKIDRIREIIYQASLKPYEARKKVFIINDAEAMNEEAQNAFLKLLEEPPQNHILILTSSNIAGLFPTVVSRCKVLKFNSLGASQIQELLLARDVPEEEAILFSHMAMGSIGRALYFKEKDIIEKRDQAVNDFFFRKSALLREDILNKEMREEVEETLNMLLCWYRDLLVSKFTQEQDRLLNIDRYSELCSYAGRFSKEKLEKDIFNIMETIGYIRRNVNTKIALFNMAVGLKRP